MKSSLFKNCLPRTDDKTSNHAVSVDLKKEKAELVGMLSHVLDHKTALMGLDYGRSLPSKFRGMSRFTAVTVNYCVPG